MGKEKDATGRAPRIGIFETVKGAYKAALASIFPGVGNAICLVAAALGLAALAGFSGSVSLNTAALFMAGFLMFLAMTAMIFIAQSAAIGIAVPLLPWVLLFRKQFWKYVAAVIAVMASAAAAAVASNFAVVHGWGAVLSAILSDDNIQMLGVLTGFGMATFVTLRLILVLPALVAGESFSFKRSWVRSSGNTFTIWGAYFLTTIPISGIQLLLKQATPVLTPAAATATILAAGLVIAVMNILLIGGVSGMAYRQLTSIPTSEGH